MIAIKSKSFDILPVPFTKELTSSEKDFLEDLIKNINRQLTATTRFLNSPEGKEYFKKIQKLKQEFFNDELLKQELDYIIQHSTDNVEQFINDFYETGAKIGYNDIKRRLNYTPADEQTLYHLTKYNFELVKNLNTELSYGIRRTIFEGAMEGKNPRQLIPIIEELPLKPLTVPLPNGKFRLISTRTRAEMIARTEYARAQCTGKLQAYANYGVEKVDVLTCGDELVCDKCKYYENHSPWDIDFVEKLLPAHPNCRCTFMAHILDDSVIPSNPLSNAEQVNLTSTLYYDDSTRNPKNPLDLNLNLHTKEELKRLSKDKNIEIKDTGTKVNFNRDNLVVSPDEKFTKVYLKDIGVTLTLSENRPLSEIYEFKKNYQELHPKLKISDDIVLSIQKPISVNNKGEKVGAPLGFVSPEIGNTIYLFQNASYLLIHESAHLLDGVDYKYSNDDDFIEAVNVDRLNRKTKDTKIANGGYVSPLAFKKYRRVGQEYVNGDIDNTDGQHAEVFAECVRLYFINPSKLKESYGEQYNYILEIFK